MKIDWTRVKRTLIQSAAGAGVAFITAITATFSLECLITASVGFVSTVVIAVLMNIKAQADEQDIEK